MPRRLSTDQIRTLAPGSVAMRQPDPAELDALERTDFGALTAAAGAAAADMIASYATSQVDESIAKARQRLAAATDPNARRLLRRHLRELEKLRELARQRLTIP